MGRKETTGEIRVRIPRREYRDLPDYFFADIILSNIETRKAGVRK